MKLLTRNLSILLVLPILFSCFGCQLTKKNKINWDELTHFRIYDYKSFPEGKSIHNFTESEIEQMNFIETDINEVKRILKESIPLGNKTYIWKGSHFALATFNNGESRKIKVSGYGGFFLDLKGEQYYEFKDNGRKEWDEFWTEYYRKLHSLDEK